MSESFVLYTVDCPLPTPIPDFWHEHQCENNLCETTFDVYLVVILSTVLLLFLLLTMACCCCCFCRAPVTERAQQNARADATAGIENAV